MRIWKCDETERVLDIGRIYYIGTRDDHEAFYALHHEVIDRIPQAERRQAKCGADEAGVDIYQGGRDVSFLDLLVAFFVSGISAPPPDAIAMGKFLFSVSSRTAEIYLPKHSAHYKKAS